MNDQIHVLIVEHKTILKVAMMPECACQRTGRTARLHELPCGEHMLIVRAPDGGWTAAEDDGKTLSRFTVWGAGESVELEDHDDGDRRRPFPDLAGALVAVCNICDDDQAPCRKR
jgi:hypothetical protein